jgi:predicted GNAT family acetyltransferase
MDNHPLDRPIWTSLTSTHSAFSEGSARALRFQKDVGPFAATLDDGEQSLSELAEVLEAAGSLVISQASTFVCPPNARIKGQYVADQLVYGELKTHLPHDTRIEALDNSDAPAMVALAKLTNPGPFARRTHLLGQFWGVKSNGQLIAMAGERLKQPGYAEISGVCTHPEAQGRGYGTALCTHLREAILERGDTPYLHVFGDNKRAVTLYKALGFKVRAKMNVVVLEYASTQPSLR